MTSVAPRHSRISGTGSFLPPDRVGNAELAARLRSGGVRTEHHVFVGSDHDLLAGRDRAVVLEALDRITGFFASELRRPRPDGLTSG